MHHAVLAVDLVRRRQQLAGRLFAQHVLARTGAQRERRIALTAFELTHGETAFVTLDVQREVGIERAFVEAMRLANGRQQRQVGHRGISRVCSEMAAKDTA